MSVDRYELAPMQEVMLFHALHAPEAGTNFNQLSCRIQGELRPHAFRQAWQHVLERHTVLRTSFHWENLERPVQEVHAEVVLPWTEEDWRDLSDTGQRARWALFLEQDLAQGFNLSVAPLMRCKLARVSEGEYLFNWSHHHILSDGWCISLVLDEVFRLYGGERDLPEPRPFRDYIQWLQRQQPAAAQDFWTRYLKGFRSSTPLPVTTQAQERFSAATTQIHLEVSSELSTSLRDFASRHALTLNTLAQGAWALILSRYSGEADVVFGTTVSGRPADLPGAQSMVGCFINAVPARVQVDPKQPLLLWLRMIQARMAARNPFDYARLPEIQRWSEVPPALPLYESNITFMNYPLDASLAQGGEGLTVSELSLFDRATVPLDLRFTAQGRWKIELGFDAQRFDAAAMHRMLGHIAAALEGFVTDPARQIGGLAILTSAERIQILEQFNATAVPFDSRDTVVHRLERWAERAPEAIAVECNEVALSARALNAHANQLARKLLSTVNLKPDDIVAICAHRSERMMEAILAIWKCGAAYVPIDPDYPAARIHTILEDSKARMVVSAAGLLDASLSIPRIDLNDAVYDGDDSNLNLPIAAESLAYVIYTSGSTGKPKGAMVEHAGMLNHMLAKVDELELNPSSIVAQNASHCFDVSVWQFFAGPLAGGKTVIFDNERVLDPTRFLDRIRDARVDILEVVPSFLTMLLEEPAAALGGLRFLMITGEMLNPALLESWFKVFPTIPAVNAYGPAEASDDVAHHRIEQAPRTPYVPIGKPIRNIKLYVCDPLLNLCPIGVTGEICVSGIGVGRGYAGNETATRAAFLDNPFKPGERMYRTGDIGCFLDDGTLLMFGRRDHQIKIRGRRIELGEIEAAIARLPGITQSVVITRDEKLVGYAAGTGWNAPQIRSALRESIPTYLVPDFIMILPELPTNSNGKIDRAALPPPDVSAQVPEIKAPPQTPLEASLTRLFSEVLAQTSVGVEDGFFDLGGHSLKAVQLLSRIRSELSREIAIADIFKHPTPRALARKLEGARNVTEDLIPALPVRPLYSASHAQKRIWLAARKAGAAYNMPSALRIHDSVDVERMVRAFETLVDRHESLRTVFVMMAGELKQRVLSRAESGFQVELTTADGEISELIHQHALQPFDLATGPLFRVTLVNEQWLLINLHHVIADVWSMHVLTDELRALYAGKGLPPLTIQYRDYAEWHNSYLNSEAMRVHRDYWHEKLASCRPKPGLSDQAGSSVEFPLGKDRLEALARAHQTSLYAVVLSLVGVALRSDDLVLSGVSAGRHRQQLESQIGVFLNPVFLRMALPGTLTVSKVIDIAAITVAEALEHADYPFDVLQEELKLRPPAIQVDYIPLFETDSDTRITDVSPVDTTSKFDLTIYVVEQREQLLVRLIYKTRAYTTQAITALQERLLKVHDAFLKDPALPIDAIVPAAEAPKIRVGLKLQGTSHVG